MKSFKTHLVEERRQLNEAFPVLFAVHLVPASLFLLSFEQSVQLLLEEQT